MIVLRKHREVVMKDIRKHQCKLSLNETSKEALLRNRVSDTLLTARARDLLLRAIWLWHMGGSLYTRILGFIVLSCNYKIFGLIDSTTCH